VTAPLLLNKLL